MSVASTPAPQASEDMVVIENVSKVFKSGKENLTAVDNVSLTVRRGEIFAIIGYSGAGKSTLVRLINGLESVSEGTLTVAGHRISGQKESALREARQNIGMIFQQFNLFPNMTVLDNVTAAMDVRDAETFGPVLSVYVYDDAEPDAWGRVLDLVDLVDAYSPRLRGLARDVEPTLAEGVYAGLPGPHYETPAEIRMLRTLGADLVGMSTVHETIAARAAGAEVLGVSMVTNLAAGMTGAPLSHAEVLEAGRQSATRMGSLLVEVLSRL